MRVQEAGELKERQGKSEKQRWTIQQASRELNVPAHTLRFWEDKLDGLITPIRTPGGQRRYDAGLLRILAAVKELRGQGMSLAEVREVLVRGEAPPAPKLRQTGIDQLAERLTRLVGTELSKMLAFGAEPDYQALFSSDRLEVRPPEAALPAGRKARTVAIIPARGGSQGIPRKNICLAAGKPLIAWTIEAALASPSLDRVLVSTDDQEIAEVALHWGAEVPFIRPAELATEAVPVVEAVGHALKWLEETEGYKPDNVMCLLPTAPLRLAGDIEAAIRLFEEKNADSLISMTPVRDHPSWMKVVDDRGSVCDFIAVKGARPPRRQELNPLFIINGAIYLARRHLLGDPPSWYKGRAVAYVMPRSRSLDVDTPWDLYLADLVLKDGWPPERASEAARFPNPNRIQTDLAGRFDSAVI